MSDTPKTDAAETPMQRALRLKKAAAAAQGGRPDADGKKPRREMQAGASRPWMKR